MADRSLIEGAEPFPRREEAPEWGYEEGEARAAAPAGRNFRRGRVEGEEVAVVGGLQWPSGGKIAPRPPRAAGSGEAPARGGRQVRHRRREERRGAAAAAEPPGSGRRGRWAEVPRSSPPPPRSPDAPSRAGGQQRGGR